MLGAGSVAGMRRLLLLVAVLVLVDTMLYEALVPLLAHFVHELGLSKTAAGALVAAYAAGALIGAIPGGLAASRLGPRRAVLCGLALMGVASVGFAFAQSFGALFAARLLQGTGSAFTWAGAFAWLLGAAPAGRRGELIGTAMGAAVFGGLIGPVVGAAAALIGRAAVFSALAALAVVLALCTMALAPAPARPSSSTDLRRAAGDRRFAGGLGLMSLGSLLFGVLSVLAPLHLAAAGWGAGAIGGIWILGATLETAESPILGRLSDRRGPLVPVRVALAAAVLISLALATGARPLVYAPLLVAASAAYGALFTPAFALIAAGAEGAGLAQGMAFGMMNAAWAIGALVGPAAAGALAGATGDWIPFVLAAAACAGTLVAMRLRAREGASARATLRAG
ncbi:MAG: transporter, family, putative family transporter protein [Solirubrobacteraceae bacterium]|nr:transporter, family, putative family transporter protein [Solirubrobacteraceae bacterium]